MGETPEYLPRVADFLLMLENIAWFANIGMPAEAGSNVKRIYDWKQWPGPEDPSVAELSLRQQAIYDTIMQHAGSKKAQYSALWNRIHGIVVRVAATKVPYDPQQDAWHAPTMAVWQAAWAAGLIGLCLCSGLPAPSDLQEQWRWFVQGHWPSGYASIGADDRLGPLLVY